MEMPYINKHGKSSLILINMVNQVCYYNHLMIDLWAYSNTAFMSLTSTAL